MTQPGVPTELKLGVGHGSSESSSIYLSQCSARGGQTVCASCMKIPCFLRRQTGHTGEPPQGTPVYLGIFSEKAEQGEAKG